MTSNDYKVRVGNSTLTLHVTRVNDNSFNIDTTYQLEIKYPKYLGIAHRGRLIPPALKEHYERLFEQEFNLSRNVVVTPKIKSFNLMSDRCKFEFYVPNHFWNEPVSKVFEKRIKEIFNDFRDEVRNLFLEHIESNGIKYRISRKPRIPRQ